MAREVESSFYRFHDGSFRLPHETTEDSTRTYVYWTPRQDVSFSAQYQNEHLSGDEDSAASVSPASERSDCRSKPAISTRTGSAPGFRASRFHQQGEFVSQRAPGVPPSRLARTISGFSTFAGYRLPNRRGVSRLNVDNVLDEEFRFQDIDPENPSIMPERMAYFRFTLSFD